MQRVGDSTSNLIPKPKLNAQVQDSVSNENASLFQAKAIWIRDAKRFIIKNLKIPSIIVNMQVWHLCKG